MVGLDTIYVSIMFYRRQENRMNSCAYMLHLMSCITNCVANTNKLTFVAAQKYYSCQSDKTLQVYLNVFSLIEYVLIEIWYISVFSLSKLFEVEGDISDVAR